MEGMITMAENPRRIIVVDDIRDWRTTVRGLLSDEGYQVETAKSSEDALRLLQVSHFDLAILDIRLDEVDEENTEGVDLATQIRHMWPSIGIVMLTGYPSQKTVEATLQPMTGKKAPADAYVDKADTAAIIPIVNRLLERS